MQRKQTDSRKWKVEDSKKNSAQAKIGIVVSQYNSDITFTMRDGAVRELRSRGVKNISVVCAPGSFEIPIVCQRLAKTKKFDGLLAIGCVIRGDTDHYVYIANESTRGIMNVMLKYDIPIANAILTVNNLKQAQIRSRGKMNKGVEAAAALLEVLS
ncbi:MAG TPA: 6,7-dimethyl-8-ribityllumazine synthase [Candidatus Paceibacterota bacterium]